MRYSWVVAGIIILPIMIIMIVTWFDIFTVYLFIFEIINPTYNLPQSLLKAVRISLRAVFFVCF